MKNDLTTFKKKGQGVYLPARTIAPGQGIWEELNPNQRKFLDKFMELHDLDEALEATGISKSTYSGPWSRDDNFRSWFHFFQNNKLQAVQHKAEQEAYNSVQRIVELRDQDEDKRTALQASKMVLNAAKDPTLSGNNSQVASRDTVWLQLFEKLVPAMQHIEGGGDYIDVDYEQVEKPSFTDSPEDDEAMEELEAKARYLRVNES